MVRPTNVLGELLQTGVRSSNTRRIEHSLGENGVAGPGGILEEILGSLPGGPQSSVQSSQTPSTTPAERHAPGGGGLLDHLKDLAGAALSDPKMQKAGGLGAIVGALLGGGGKSVKGAVGGGAMALLGMIAMQALRNAGGKAPLDPSSKLAAGLRAPENSEEEREVESLADLTVRAMINAAKADGRIDESELQRITSQFGELDADEREFIISEMRKPLDIDSIAQAVPNAQVAAQVYVASLLATNNDSPAEKRYMAELANKLRLAPQVTAHLHRAVGMPA